MASFEARLLRYTSRLVPESEAREIVQEAFLRLLREDPAKTGDPPLAWLYTVCRNQAVDRRRRERHLATGADVARAIDPSPSPEARVMNAKAQSGMLRALAALPAEQQEVIRLKFQEELSYKEISVVTGHSISYVGVLIHTAMMSLRKRLEGKR